MKPYSVLPSNRRKRKKSCPELSTTQLKLDCVCGGGGQHSRFLIAGKRGFLHFSLLRNHFPFIHQLCARLLSDIYPQIPGGSLLQGYFEYLAKLTTPASGSCWAGNNHSASKLNISNKHVGKDPSQASKPPDWSDICSHTLVIRFCFLLY